MKYLDIILKKMFSMVKADYSKFKNEPNWFMKRSWTEEQQNKFRQWLIDYMTKNSEARQELMSIRSKKFVNKFVDEFIFNYGWKIKKGD